MNVVYLSSEVAPYSKTGGLADVSGALPGALGAAGVEVAVVTPRYASIDASRFGLARRLRTLHVTLGSRTVEVAIYEGRLGGTEIPVYFVDHEPSFGRAGLYGEGGSDYPDNAARFALLVRAALALADTLPRPPSLVHAHDWQTALAPYYLRHSNVGSVFTIHNLAFQGLAPPSLLEPLDIDPALFHPDAVEFYGQVNLLKAGVLFADRVTTVSPRYAREIQTPALGCGLDGFLRVHADKLTGILNGVDYGIWDPSVDPRIPRTYSPDDLDGKADCKAHLQRKLGLPVRADVPLLGSISRLTEQKGFDLVAAIAQDLARLPLQYAVLGSGDRAIEQALEELAAAHPSKFAVRIAYDDTLAHEIEAGADLFLMPSRFEPCGLNQMYSLRYGTLPLVRATGGLDDTIVDWDPATRTGNGFKLDEYSPATLLATIERACAAWQDREAWQAAMRRAMAQDFSWNASARRYVGLYEEVVASRSR